MESLLSMTSLGGSIFSASATAYFWFVKARGERAQLRPYILDREFFLGVSTPDARHIGLKVGLVVVNNSTLPNAILRVKFEAKTRRGGWLELAGFAVDKATPLPINLPPLTTSLVRAAGTLAFPYSNALEDGNKTVANYLGEHLSTPRVVRVMLHHLNDRVDATELALPDAG